jgi:outer membrane protein OmpA-like peptidoglycan-associated protein
LNTVLKFLILFFILNFSAGVTLGQNRIVASDTIAVVFSKDSVFLDQKNKKEIDSLFDQKMATTILMFGYGDYRDEKIMKAYEERFSMLESYIATEVHQNPMTIKEVVKQQNVEFQESEKVTLVVFYETVEDIKGISEMEESLAAGTYDLGKGNIVLSGLTFFPGRHYPTEESLPVLDTLLATMIQHPELNISIEGHICCVKKNTYDGLDIDTGEFNLSEKRAEYVYNFLLQNGIDADRMAYIGFGARKRVVKKEKTAEDEERNRRVEIRVVNPGDLTSQ